MSYLDVCVAIIVYVAATLGALACVGVVAWVVWLGGSWVRGMWRGV